MPDSNMPQTRVDDPAQSQQKDWTPRPDPTTLTSQALYRETSALSSLLDMRMHGMDELMDEKFRAVEKEFLLIESRRIEQKQDTKAALDAALAAAKEAVSEQTIASEKAINKSETSTDKRIDQLGEKFDTAFVGQRRDIDSIRERLLVIEAMKLGSQETVDTQSQKLGFFVGGFGLLLTLISIILIVGEVLTK